jgi:hypothetical protein
MIEGMDGEGQDMSGSAAVRERISAYVDAQLARLLESVIAVVNKYQQGAADVREANRVIEHYYEAAQALSRWAASGLLSDHVAFLDADGSDAFDWWGAPDRDRSDHLNSAVADRESRELQESRVRWPWSKVQRSDSSKGG